MRILIPLPSLHIGFRLLILSIFLVPLSVNGLSQSTSPSLTNEMIWKERHLSADGMQVLNYMNDGRHYTQLLDNVIYRFDIEDDQGVESIFSIKDLKLFLSPQQRITNYFFSPDESKLLIEFDGESLYRYSVKGLYVVYDRTSGHATYIDTDKVFYPSFNPSGDQVAYVKENNLYVYDIEKDTRTQITSDGRKNEIINGAADWVYEEELKLTRAFSWSPKGDYLAYIKFDESEVPIFRMNYYTDQSYPEEYTFKYPKVSQPNAKVQVFTYHIPSGTTDRLSLPQREEDFYIPRISWIPDSDKLIVFYLNRLQNKLSLRQYEMGKSKAKEMMTELSDTYLSIHDHLTFLPNGKGYLWMSERNGWNQVHLFTMQGQWVRTVTKGEFDCTDFYGYDKETDQIYVQVASKNPMEREVASFSVETGEMRYLADQKGWNQAMFSPSMDYYILYHSTMNQPPSYTLYRTGGEKIRTIISNEAIREKQRKYNVQEMQTLTIPTEDEVSLQAFMVKPPTIKPGESYPVLMYCYGGPNSQVVTHRWKGAYYWWFQMLAQKGYVVVGVDNRGTGARGRAFRKCTYKQLGRYESEDQIRAAQYIANLGYVDQDNIGIFGWSYGGYLSSLALLKGNDVFSLAVAVAPVTNWKWYDSIYTERYMQRYEDNQAGYDENAPMFYVDRLQGDYLLVHGLADDNVHFQHSAEMMNALMKANKQFDTYVYPNDAHGIAGEGRRLHLFTKITSFLEENLK